jgi:hypothetical protein
VLTYQGCITGEIATGPTVGGNNSCLGTFPTPQTNGNNSGLDKVRNLAIDANGESLHATSGQDDSLSHFSRDTGTGALTYVDCLTAETGTGSAGTAACTDILPGTVTNGTNSGFDNPQAVTISPNGASVYVGSGNDASITRFSRTAGTGAIAWQDCFSADSNVGVDCTHLSGDMAEGSDTGFANLRAVAVSPDGSSLYAISFDDASIVHFSRDAGTGALTFVSCLSGDTQTGPISGTDDCSLIPNATPQGLDSGWGSPGILPNLAIKSDGTQVFFGTTSDHSVVALDRNVGTGALSFRRCISSETESATNCALISPAASNGTGTALHQVDSLAMSPDGKSVYTTSFFADDVARFAIEQPPPPVVSPPVPTGRRAAAIKRCKKKFRGKVKVKKRKRCIKRAKRLPI